MSKSYPSIGMRYPKNRSLNDGVGTCDNCGLPINVGAAYSRVDIQVGWFRGDDETADVCALCKKKPLNAHVMLRNVQAKREPTP